MAASGTLRERALDAIERYRAEHPGATIASAAAELAGELDSTPASVLDAYYTEKRRRDGRPIRKRRQDVSGTDDARAEALIAESRAFPRDRVPRAPADVPAILRRAADEIERLPGTNVLDALNEAHEALEVPDRSRADAYYALLDYLPLHVDMLAPWSDSETPDRVANRLRQCARTIEKGGPAIVPADPHMPPDLAAHRLARQSG